MAQRERGKDLPPATEECDDLRLMLDSVQVMNHGSLSIHFEQLEGQLKEITRMADPLQAEIALIQWRSAFRETWLTVSHHHSHGYYKSPLSGTRTRLPSGLPISYSYERNVYPTLLEERAAYQEPSSRGWSHDYVLFSSGMSAIASFLITFLGMNRADPLPIHLCNWGAYFETKVLLELFKSKKFSWDDYRSDDDVFREIVHGESDVFFIEPVRYDWDLDVFDLSGMAQALRSAPPKQRFIIFDTTLVSSSLPVSQFLEAIRNTHTTVVLVRSCLKLDQQGLELSNAGLVSVHTTKGGAGPTAGEFGLLLRKMRTVLGTGLSVDEVSALEFPLFLHQVATTRYAESVFLNNALLANSVPVGGIFKRVSHPSLGPRAHLRWARAPFVVFHLAEDTLDNHGLLLGVLRHESREVAMDFALGSSFGFRSHRYEVIIPRLSEERGLFKIAMGRGTGTSRNRAIELVAKLATYGSISALRRAYPNVPAVNLHDTED